MRNSPGEASGALGPNPPDARPTTHDLSESARADRQPYAAENEDYKADNLETPEEKSGDRKRPRQGAKSS